MTDHTTPLPLIPSFKDLLDIFKQLSQRQCSLIQILFSELNVDSHRLNCLLSVKRKNVFLDSKLREKSFSYYF